MNPSLRQLRAVVEVARLRSFTRAAERLHITQQGLSLAIRELEAQLGSTLFERTTRAVALTEAGRHFVPVAEQAVRAMEEAAAAVAGMAAGSSRRLVVAATPLVAASLLPRAYAAFRSAFPEVEVRVVDVERQRVQQLVESGEADVGFGAFFKPAAALRRELIHRCEMVCFMATGSAPSAPAVAWKSLAREPLLGLPADNEVQKLVDARLAQAGAADEERPVFRNMQTILAMVEAGFGKAILPSFALAAIRGMQVEARRLSGPPVPVDFFRINRKGAERSAIQSSFAEAVQAQLRSSERPAARSSTPVRR